MAPSSRALRLGVGALLLTVGALSASAAPPDGDAPPAEVAIAPVHAETVAIERELVGRLAATRIAEVRARVAGIVLERVYTEGTDVEAGAVLFRIDPAPLRAALHAEQAALASAKAAATNAALTAKRYQEMHAKKLISQADLDSAKSEQRTTAAAVQEAEAKVESAELDLGYATVTTPISGRAGRALVTEGALVGQGEATLMTTVEQIDPLYVNFGVSASQWEQWRRDASGSDAGLGTTVRAVLADGSDYAHPGTLDFADASVAPGTGVVSLRAVLPNPERRLLPGMFVHLKLTVSEIPNAFRVPHAALSRDATSAYLLVVGADDKIERRDVDVRETGDSEFVLTGALADGDRVVVEGLQKVKPGDPATPVAAPHSPD